MQALSQDDRNCFVDVRGNWPPVFSSPVIVPSAGVENVQAKRASLGIAASENGDLRSLDESEKCSNTSLPTTIQWAHCSVPVQSPHGQHIGLQIG
ncbi:hypothetical protein KL918_004730 [Ogataea parapolymorpha]|nr:hypothetical protein KL918_004730 [Ogataea parapolymorpha]KAG7872733.1 hypothetical protein KL916_002778 [Ogataea parapolymorpha]